MPIHTLYSCPNTRADPKASAGNVHMFSMNSFMRLHCFLYLPVVN